MKESCASCYSVAPPQRHHSHGHPYHCRVHSAVATHSSSPSFSYFFLLAITVVLSAFLSFIPLTEAQSEGPIGRRRMAFAQSGDSLYIQGGFSIQSYSSQFQSLDLSKSWPTSAPAWSMLPDGPSVTHHAMVRVAPQHSAGLGGGKQGYLLLIGGAFQGAATQPFFNAYDLESRVWSSVPVSATSTATPYTALEGHTAVSDPDTGLVYIVGGYWTGGIYNALMVFDPSNRSIVSLQSEAAQTASLTDVAAIWSSVRKTVLTFGGSRAPPSNPDGLGLQSLSEYDPKSQSWRQPMRTSGSIPRRLDHCVAASDDGSKIVLFGGSLDNTTFFSDIHILDVTTGQWKAGSPASTPRTRMSCAFHRGQFIAWGGSSGDKRDITMHNNIPIVYNVARDEWVQNYTSDPSASPSVDPTHGDDKTNLGPIIGGAVGGVVVLIGCIAAFIIIRRKKRAAKKDPVSNGDKVGGSGGAGGGKHSSSNDDYDDGLGYIAGPRTGNRQQQRYTNVNMVDDSEPEAHHYPDNRYSMGPMVQTSNHLAATNGLGGVGQDPYYAVEPGVGAIAGAGAGAMYGHPLPGEHPLPGGANTMSGYWDPLAGYMDPAAARPLSGAGMPLEENAYSPQTFVDPYKIPPPAGYEAPPDIGAKVIPWPPVQYQGAQYQEQQQYSPQHLQFQQQQYSPQYSPAQQQEKLAYHDQYSQRSSYAPPLSPPASTSSANSPYPYKTPYDDMSPKSSKDQRLSMQNTNRLSGPQSIRDSSGSAFSDSKSARAPQVLHPVGEDLGYVAPPK